MTTYLGSGGGQQFAGTEYEKHFPAADWAMRVSPVAANDSAVAR